MGILAKGCKVTSQASIGCSHKSKKVPIFLVSLNSGKYLPAYLKFRIKYEIFLIYDIKNINIGTSSSIRVNGQFFDESKPLKGCHFSWQGNQIP